MVDQVEVDEVVDEAEWSDLGREEGWGLLEAAILLGVVETSGYLTVRILWAVGKMIWRGI